MSIYSAKDIGLDLPVAAQGNDAGQGLYSAKDIGLAHLGGPTSSTSKRGFGSSLVKSVARIGESVANLVEGDPLKVDRADAGLFSSGETDWQMDDMGNLTGFDTRPAKEIRKDNYGLVSRAAGAVRKSLHDVKGGEYEKGSAAEVAGAVIENAPHSLIYMLPHFMLGGGNISNAIMYQDTYLSRLKELRDLRAQGKIEATDQDIENNASKYGFAEMMPEAVGNASEAAIIKGVSRIVPGLSAFPKAMEFISKIKGPKTGSALIAELFPSTARKAGRVVTAGVASAPIEGLTEYITETGLGSMEGQAPLDLSIGSATIPGGMSREAYIADRGKFAATVGALSGAAISGTMGAVSQVNQSNSRDAFVSDIVSPIDAVNPESDETKVAAGKRFGAISDLITIIGQSGISEEEKTNAAVNLLQAFDRNEKVDLQNIFVEPADLAEVEDVGETSVGEELRTGGSVIEAETQAKVDRAVEGLKAINIEEESAIQEPIELTEQDIIKEPRRDYKAEFDAFSQREITDTQVVASTRVDAGFAKILKGVHDRIGTKANIALFSTIDFAGEEGSAFREYLETQGHSVLDIRGGRVFQSERDGKKFYTIVANTDTRLQARSAIFMHEALGHITMMEHFDLAPAELQRALLKEFAQWKKFDRTPEGFLSFDSFNEDFGDPKTLLWSSLIGRPGESRQQVNRRSFHEFMAHRLSSKMQQRPEVQGIIQRYWASLKEKINKMYEAFKAEYLDIATNVDSVDEFIDFLFKTGNYAEVQQDNVENLNSISEAPTQVDEKTRLIQAVFDSMFEVVNGKRVLKSAWRFKKVFKDGNRSLVSRKDIESSGIYYKEERGKTVVYKNKDVLFTIPWDASRNLSAQSARMIATNLRDLYILATLQPSHVERAKANSTKMLNTSTGKKVTVKMGNRAARTLEIMWERAATLAVEQGITERQAFLLIMSGEGSAFSSLRPGVAGTEATGSLRKNMDRWIAMHESDLSSMLQETPTAEPMQVEQELVKEHIEEPKQTALSAEVTQTIDQVRGIIETWWNKAKPSERVQDFEGLTQKVIFYFDLNGKDYTEVKPEIRNLIGATIKDVLQEKTGAEVQSEVKNKLVQRDKVLQMHKAGMDTTLAEVELQSFDLFGNYEKVVAALGEDLTLGSYTDNIDGFKKAYFSDRDISFVPLASGVRSPPGNGFIRPSWKRNSDAGKLTLRRVIEHQDLFAVYPELKTLKVKFFNGMGNAAGSADWQNWTINVDYNQEVETVRSTILHEIQHIIQAQESWAGGQSMAGAKSFKDQLRFQRERLGRDISTFIAINKMIKAGKSYQEAMSDYMQANRFNGIKLQSANYIATLAADMGWEKLSEELQQARVDAAKATIFDTGSAFEAYRHAAGEEEARRAEALFYFTDNEVRVAFKDKGIAAGSDISDRSFLYKTDSRTLQVMLSATETVEETSNDELTYASYDMLNSFDLKVIPFAKPVSKKTIQDYTTQLSNITEQEWTSGKLFHYANKLPEKLKALGLSDQDITKINKLKIDQTLLLESFGTMRGIDLEYQSGLTSADMYNKAVQDTLTSLGLSDWFSTYRDFLHNPNIWDASRERYSNFSEASGSGQAYAVVALALGATSEAIRNSESTNLRAAHQGKRAVADIINPITDEIIVPANGIITSAAMDQIIDIGIEKIKSKPALSLVSFDLKISPKRRGQRKETTAGPYAGIIKQARKASKPRKPSVVDPLKLEKKRSALFSFLEKMDVIRERGEQLGLSTSEVMLKLGFAPDQVRKHIARYNRHKSKFSQNETIIRLAEIAGLINEETGRENLESLIKTMFPPTEFEEVQPDGTVKKVTDPGSDGSLQSLSTIARDMLINKLQTIIASSTGSKFDIENERSLGESIEEYKQEWASTGRLKKLGGFLKYVQSSAADFLESTKSGKELSFKLRRYLLTKTVMQRNYLVELNDFARKYSSVEERQRFYEVISGQREAQTDDERKFANLVKSINRTYGTEMQTLQVRVYKKDGSFTFFRYNQDMSDSYFPHMWKAEWFRNPTQDMIQSLLDSGEAQDRAHAKRIIQDFHKQTIRDRKFANVERARETELGGWITDPIEVYQKYVLGASARLASLREFGSTPEVVLAQLAIRHLKESRDPEALSKTRDLINRVLGTKIEDQLLKEPKAAMSFGVMYSVGLLLQHSMLVQPGVMANMGALGGYKNLVKGISAVLPALWGNNKGQMNKRWAELAGVLAFTVNRELNDIVMDDETRLKSDKILRSFGITQVDAAMRIVGAIVGKLYATDVAMKYAATGDAKSAQRLRRLGIDPRKITKDYLQSQEWYTKDLRMAALAFTEDTNFVLDPMRMPSITQGHPLARILFLFKNFAFQQHRFLLRLLREDKGKAFKSLVGSLSGGALIMLVRMLLQGDDPEKILEKDGIAKTVWRAFMAGGGAGLFAEAVGSAVIPGSGPQTGMALDSPVFGLLETLGRGGKSLYNLAEGDATDQDMHNLYRSAIMTLQGGALAMPAQVGVPLNAAIGFTRPVAERAIAPSDRQRETSYLQ